MNCNIVDHIDPLEITITFLRDGTVLYTVKTLSIYNLY